MKILLITVSLFITTQNNFRNLDSKTDLIIVGGGLTGLISAYEFYIKSNGLLNIILIDKLPNLGGNSNKAASGINLLETEPQKINNIIDNYSIFYSDTMKSGKNINNPSLVNTLITGTKTLYDYLKNNFDINITLLYQLNGHSIPRTHRPTDSNYIIGSYLISKISEKVKTCNNIRILYNSTVTEILKNETTNEIYGLKYNTSEQQSILYCKGIILASGGYGHDFSEDGLLNEFAPNYIKYPTTNGEQSIGSGIQLGRKIGADLVDMNYIQIHPTGFVNPKNRFEKKKYLAPELLRGVGGILINENGERFCNELGSNDYVAQQIIQNCKKQDTKEIEQYESYLLLNEEMANEFGNNYFNYYKNIQGFITEHSNFKEMANNLNIDYNNLEKTIISYNNAFDNNFDEFNKTIFPYKFDLNKKIYSMIITPSIHYTMGGLKINNKGEILNSSNEIIKGLYGAGEVTGGVHGANRLGGNSLSDCGVYGIISANSALDYVLSKSKSENIIIIKKGNSGDISSGAIAGIIIGGLALLIIIILAIIYCICKRKKVIPAHNISVSNSPIINNNIK